MGSTIATTMDRMRIAGTVCTKCTSIRYLVRADILVDEDRYGYGNDRYCD